MRLRYRLTVLVSAVLASVALAALTTDRPPAPSTVAEFLAEYDRQTESWWSPKYHLVNPYEDTWRLGTRSYRTRDLMGRSI